MTPSPRTVPGPRTLLAPAAVLLLALAGCSGAEPVGEQAPTTGSEQAPSTALTDLVVSGELAGQSFQPQAGGGANQDSQDEAADAFVYEPAECGELIREGVSLATDGSAEDSARAVAQSPDAVYVVAVSRELQDPAALSERLAGCEEVSLQLGTTSTTVDLEQVEVPAVPGLSDGFGLQISTEVPGAAEPLGQTVYLGTVRETSVVVVGSGNPGQPDPAVLQEVFTAQAEKVGAAE